MTEVNRTLVRLALSTLLFGSVCALSGCETWKGFGKDVEDVGESMQGGHHDDDVETEDTDDEG